MFVGCLEGYRTRVASVLEQSIRTALIGAIRVVAVAAIEHVTKVAYGLDAHLAKMQDPYFES
jgi:hypothetical protein